MGCYRFIKIFLLFLFFTFSFATEKIMAVDNNGKVLRVGVYDNKPKVFRQADGVISGLFPDVLNYIAKQEKWKLEYVHGNWNEGLSRLKKGEIDIMVDVAISEERQKEFDFTNETILSSWGVVCTKKNSGINYFTDLEGKKIGILKSSIYLGGTEGIDRYLKSFGIKAEFVFVDEYNQVYSLLDQGKIDAGVVSRIFALTNVKNYPGIKQTGIFFNPTELRFALTKDGANNSYLIEKLDYWVKKIKAEQGSIYYKSLINNGLEAVNTGKIIIPIWIYPVGLIGTVIIFFSGLIIFRLVRTRLIYIRKLHESENKFSIAFKFSPYVMVITKIKDGKFLDVNDAFVSFTGFTREESLSSSSISLKLWSKKEDRDQMVADLAAGRPVINREFVFKTKKGELLTGLFSAQLVQINNEVCILSSIANINDLKIAEQKILEFKKRDEAILQSIGEGLFTVDLNGKIVLVNHAFENLLGWEMKEVCGKKIVDLIPITDDQGKPLDHEKYPTFIGISKGIEVISNNYGYYFVKKDLSKIPVFYHIAPVIVDGKIIGAVGVFRDITFQLELDKAKTEFVSIASHELRAPLGIIKSFLSMLFEGDYGPINSKLKEPLAEIKKSADRLIYTVNDILNISRIESGKMVFKLSKFSTKNLITETISNFKRTINKKITIKSGELVDSFVLADSEKVLMILNNLISNAIKFTHQGEIIITSKLVGKFVHISVSDTGVGIDPADQKTIFNKFQQVTTNELGKPSGTGLGLYISQSLVEKMGGKIWIKSSIVGKGSIFVFSLPKAKKVV